MRNLFDFLLKNTFWFVFILLELVCFYFIFSNNSYQRSVYINSSNELVGRVYSISGKVNAYFGLQKQNQDLLDKNAQLQSQILGLEGFILENCTDSIKSNAFVKDSLGRSNASNYDIMVARVINNTVNQSKNYIVINRGTNDNVGQDVGVISEQGIVGVVRAVSENFAIVQPVLNPDTKLNCKIQYSNTTGTLVWDGKDPRYATMVDFPKYEKSKIGDVIITSGFSYFFPEGIHVGTVSDIQPQKNDNNFVCLTIKLSTDFGSLKDVLLIRNKSMDELKALENSIKDVKK